MRHSTIDLTMNVYTDPKLLDIHGALNALPSLDLNADPLAESQSMRATGTDGDAQAANRRLNATAVATEKSFVAPNSGKSGQSVSFAVIGSKTDDEVEPQRSNAKSTTKPSEKALPTVFVSKAF